MSRSRWSRISQPDSSVDVLVAAPCGGERATWCSISVSWKSEYSVEGARHEQAEISRRGQWHGRCARAVEEVLARGGADLFDIVMFGDEPYGNYNRIMLSNILSGQQNYDEIYLNPLDWYGENNIVAAFAGARVNEIDRFAKYVVAENGVRESPTTYLLIATGSRAFMPPIPGLHMDGQVAQAGRVRVPHDRRHDGDGRRGAGQEGSGDRRRAAGARGGARADDAWVRGHRGASRRASDGYSSWIRRRA